MTRRHHARGLTLLVLLLGLWGVPPSTHAQVVVDDSGKVGIGTVNPTAKLHAAGSGGIANLQRSSSSGTAYIQFLDQDGNAFGYVGQGGAGADNLQVASYHGAAAVYGAGAYLDGSASVNGFAAVRPLSSGGNTNICIFMGGPSSAYAILATCSSSHRYKEDISPLHPDFDQLLKLQGIKFKWKDRDEKGVGLIAEDVAERIPELVTYKDGKIEGVEYRLLSVFLLELVKKQDLQIKDQKNQIEGLWREVKDIRSTVRSLNSQ